MAETNSAKLATTDNKSRKIEKTKKTWKEILEENKGAFQEALPKIGITPEKVVRTVLTAMRLNPDLQRCEVKSVIASIIQACELNLSLSPSLGQAYLVPFNNTDKGTKDCVFIPGYRGYIALMKRTGKVDDVKSIIVYEDEPFEMSSGTNPFIKHTQLPPDKRGDKVIGAYTTVALTSGYVAFEFMWINDIMRHRDRSKAKNGPWKTDTEEMIKKTPIRAISKRMELSPEVTKAALHDEYTEAGIETGDLFADDGALEEGEKTPSLESSVKTIETTSEKISEEVNKDNA